MHPTWSCSYAGLTLVWISGWAKRGGCALRFLKTIEPKNLWKGISGPTASHVQTFGDGHQCFDETLVRRKWLFLSRVIHIDGVRWRRMENQGCAVSIEPYSYGNMNNKIFFPFSRGRKWCHQCVLRTQNQFRTQDPIVNEWEVKLKRIERLALEILY